MVGEDVIVEHIPSRIRPLADRLRPKNIDEVVGQEKLLGKGDGNSPKGSLRICLESEKLPSMVLWGPPGTGKTSVARLLSQSILNCKFISISAVSSGVSDLKKIFAQALETTRQGYITCLFIDEIHRFNKAQQDALLHYVEDGTILLIGATTENPSFEVNSALLSRVRVFILEPLSYDSLSVIFQNAEKILEHEFDMESGVLDTLCERAGGDARIFLNLVEQLYVYQSNNKSKITSDALKDLDLYAPAVYDKDGEQHYSFISALHKCIRGSDCDAALYWFSRMLEGGEDPRYIARRLLRMAYEDIGLADTDVASYTLDAWNTYERLGSPEGELSIASAIIYLALSPKSNSVYTAYSSARASAVKTKDKSPPKHILNAPTQFMKKIGYGEGYEYDHDQQNAFSGQQYFPEGMERECYYAPQERGFEREMKKRLEYFVKLREKLQK